MTPEIAALVGTVVGLIGGALITYWGSVKLSRKQSVALAAVRMIDAFKDEISLLSNPVQDGLKQGELLESAFKKHYTAYVEFAFYLNKSEKNELEEAWRHYCCREDNPDFPFVVQYSEHQGDINLARKNREEAVTRLKAIVALAAKKL